MMKLKWKKRDVEKEIPDGSYRNKIWFALLPVWIEYEGVNEVKWLRIVRVKQRYYNVFPVRPVDEQIGWWENFEFLEP